MTTSETRTEVESDPARYVVLAAIDFSDASQPAMREALRLTRERAGAELHVANVYKEREGRARRGTRLEEDDAALAALPEALRDLVVKTVWSMPDPAWNGHRIGVHVRLGDPVAQILQLAIDLDADAIIVGTHGRRGVERLVLGSVAEGVLRDARCAVFVARAKTYEGSTQSQEIEAACSACVQRRRDTGGAEWWCDEHVSPRPPAAHVYSSSQVISWSSHDSDVSGPTGVRMI